VRVIFCQFIQSGSSKMITSIFTLHSSHVQNQLTILAFILWR
jgi:hypothetical protein